MLKICTEVDTMSQKNQNLTADEILRIVYDAIKVKGYDPARQIAGYIISEDPTYIPDYNNARGLIRHINRDDLLKLLIEFYFENRKEND